MNDTKNFHIDLQRTLIQDGPKFLSHTVVINDEIAFLKPTIGAMLFCVVYILVGFFLISLASYIYFDSQTIDLTLFVGGFGIAILTFGVSLIQPFLKRASFDKRQGLFKNSSDRNVKLRRVLSLQINNKIVIQKQALNYPCYELNMLTKNGRRLNILNHNDLTQMLKDAKKLGAFLNVEVQDRRREIIL